MNKRLPVWVSSIPGGKKCCPLHLERQTKCILMCSCSPSPEPQSAQGIWLERVSLKQMLIIDLFCALHMPSLSQLLNAHFQVIEIHWEVWLICEYRLAPLPPRQSCLLGSPGTQDSRNIWHEPGRMENNWPGVGMRG